MAKQGKVLFARTRAKQIEDQKLGFYNTCKTLKVYKNKEWDKKLVEVKNNKHIEELRQQKRELNLQVKAISKQNTILFKQLRRCKQFEQEMVA